MAARLCVHVIARGRQGGADGSRESPTIRMGARRGLAREAALTSGRRFVIFAAMWPPKWRPKPQRGAMLLRL